MSFSWSQFLIDDRYLVTISPALAGPLPKKKKKKKRERPTNSPIRLGRTTESKLIADVKADRDGAEADHDGHRCRIFSVTDELSSGDE